MFVVRPVTGASLREGAQHFCCNSYKMAHSSLAQHHEQRRSDVALTESLENSQRPLKLTHQAFRVVVGQKSARGAGKRDDGWYMRVADFKP